MGPASPGVCLSRAPRGADACEPVPRRSSWTPRTPCPRPGLGSLLPRAHGFFPCPPFVVGRTPSCGSLRKGSGLGTWSSRRLCPTLTLGVRSGKPLCSDGKRPHGLPPAGSFPDVRVETRSLWQFRPSSRGCWGLAFIPCEGPVRAARGGSSSGPVCCPIMHQPTVLRESPSAPRSQL